MIAVGDRPDGKEGDGNLSPDSAAKNLDTIPLDSLAMPDDQEQMQPPEVGDEVNYQVTGKVVSIDGGNAQIERTSINGNPVPGADDDDDEPDADEGESLRNQAGGMGMLTAILLLFGLFLSHAASAQNTRYFGNAQYTNSLIATTNWAKLYSLTGYNSSGNVQYIQIFETNAVPANGTVPAFSMPVPATSYYSWDFSYYGLDLDDITVCSSTTANSLTLSGTNTTFQVITKTR